MNQDDSKKLVVLVVSVGAVFGLAYWRVSTILQPNGGPSFVADSRGKDIRGALPNLEGNEVDEPEVTVSNLMVRTTSNPFRQVMETKRPVAPPIFGRPQPTYGPDVPFQPTPLIGVPGSPSQSGPMTRPAAIRDIKLTGVIDGSKPLAIVVIGTESFVVGKDQPFGDGFVITRIGRDNAEVKHGKSTLNLVVGQDAVRVEDFGQDGDIHSDIADPSVVAMEQGTDEPIEDIEVATLFAQSDVDPFREVLPKSVSVPSNTGDHSDAEIPRRFRMTGLEGTLPPARPEDYMTVPGTLPDPTLEPAKAPQIVVTGIIGGSNAVAVIEVDGQSYVIGIGVPFADGLEVIEIEKDYVRIRRGKETLKVPVSDEPPSR